MKNHNKTANVTSKHNLGVSCSQLGKLPEVPNDPSSEQYISDGTRVAWVDRAWEGQVFTLYYDGTGEAYVSDGRSDSRWCSKIMQACFDTNIRLNSTSK